MHYYKSQELADLYGVSRRTVTNWIKQTREGKLDLELGEDKNEFYIIKSRLNQNKIDQIVSERQKYLNSRSRKQVTPKPQFYQIYSEQQIYDIIQSLQLYRELPLKYSYFGEGAKLWDEFRSYPGGTFDTKFLVESNQSYIDAVLQKFEKINIVDIGVGNGLGAKEVIEYAELKGKLNKYVGIDISSDMLTIAKNNIKLWFGNKVTCEMHECDISNQTFGDIIAEPVNNDVNTPQVGNLLLLFGGSISNFKYPNDVLRNINKSMGSEDILLCQFKIGTEAVKNRLSFIVNYQNQSSTVLDLLGIDKSLYSQEIGFDEKEAIRFGRIRLNRTLKIDFHLPKGKWQVDLKKQETILTYRASFNDPFNSPKNLFYNNGFKPLLTARTLDNTGMLVLADLDIQ